MIEKIIDLLKVHAFSILSFSIFGLMFAMRPMTLMPTVILLCCAVAVAVNFDFRRKLLDLIKDTDLRWIAIAFATWFSACLFVGVWHWGFSKQAFLENPFRIFLALSLLPLFVSSTSNKTFVVGMIVGSVCIILNVAFGHLFYDEYFPRISGTTNHPVHFGNFAALLCVLLASAAMLFVTLRRDLRLICLGGSALAFFAAIASQSRSSFVVLLCLIPLLFVAKSDLFHQRCTRFFYLLTIAFALLVAGIPSLQQKLRFTAAVSDIQMIESDNYQGSMGSRLAMWQGAWSMFKTNPIVGIGPHKFQSEFIKQMQTGEVPRADAEHNQPHNDLLNAAATGGIIKLMAYVLLIAGPFVFFYKKYKAKNLVLNERIFPIMGMQVVGAFFLTGLTNSNFDLQIYSTMYAVLVCVLARLSVCEINAAAPSTPFAQARSNN
jgi:O-antigen ligase